MAATYDASLPSDKDWVRFLIGDRDVTNARISDEEITAVLAEEANKYCAAARCAQLAFAGTQGVTMKAVDDLRIEYGDDPDSAYWKYVDTLRDRCAKDSMSGTTAGPHFFKVVGTRSRLRP